MRNAARRTPVRLAVAATLGLTLLLAACSSDPEPSRSSVAKASDPSPTPTTPPPPPQPSLLSGRMDKPDQPVIAAKIDNTAKAHPQVGLTKADVVYVEQVEGGVTRLAAIFSSDYPNRIGPVRSARITDIELLRQYGKVGLIYSGSQTRLHDNLVRAKLGLVSFDQSWSGYTRSPSRPQPYDVIGTFDRLVDRAGKVDPPKEVGYTFGDPPAGGKKARRFTAVYPGARVSGEWSAQDGRWLLSMDGVPDRAAEGGRLGPTTFVVQFATVRPSTYRDVNGANTPMTETVGKGKTLVFRDGMVYEGKWERAKAWKPTTYTIGGQPAVFSPGQIWVALIGRNQPVTVG